MTEEPSPSVSVIVEYGERFRRQVVDADQPSPDPLMAMKIVVDGEYLMGNSKPGHGAGGYMTDVFGQYLAVVEDLHTGEGYVPLGGFDSVDRYVVEHCDGPTWTTIEPRVDHVELAHCLTVEGVRSPEKRLSSVRAVTVPVDSWTEAVVDAATEYYRRMVDSNPPLRSDSELQSLRTTLDSLD
ncbi:hypothetical protein [Haloprofundus salinisoli]|uniref:hypothetical protein n=1 Tax=Haloprofundus salinisoli TaxID=2876193 RepID=UPI001CC9B652|nr:hypothetical protein [Haloprofundus salinisoli]